MKNIDLRYERNYFYGRAGWGVAHNDVSTFLSTLSCHKLNHVKKKQYQEYNLRFLICIF